MEDRKFQFYVVAIPDEFTILVNGGRNYNESIYESNLQYIEEPIKVGDSLSVVIPGKEIFDPKTKSSLGFYDYVKESLEVTKIHWDFFECAKITKTPNGVLGSLSPMFGSSENKLAELKVNNKDLIDTDSFDFSEKISIGDPVRFNY